MCVLQCACVWISRQQRRLSPRGLVLSSSVVQRMLVCYADLPVLRTGAGAVLFRVSSAVRFDEPTSLETMYNVSKKVCGVVWRASNNKTPHRLGAVP